MIVPKLRFPEFQDMGGWELSLLDSRVKKVGSGITPTGGEKKYKNAGRPFVRSQNVGWGKLLLNDVAYIDDKTHASFSSTEIQNEDVLLNITGASIGRSVVADERIVGGNVNQHVCIIRVKAEYLSPKLLSQYLLSEYGQKQIDSFQAGGNRQGLNFAQVRSFVIPQPIQIEEQKKIADCLSSIDELITMQSQKFDVLKIYKKGLMQWLFPDKGDTLPRLRFPKFQSAPEWELLQIGEKVNLLSGYPFDGTDMSEDFRGTRLLRGINITEGQIRHSADIDRYYLGSTEKLEKYRLQRNDLVIAMDGSKVGKNVALIDEINSGALLIQRVARLRANCEVLIQFLYQQINSSKFHTYVDKINTSSGIPHISAKQINEFEVCFPAKEEQEKIANCLSFIDALLVAQMQKINALKDHKKSLMQQLFPNINKGGGNEQ